MLSKGREDIKLFGLSDTEFSFRVPGLEETLDLEYSACLYWYFTILV